jgi:hypothetical protein
MELLARASQARTVDLAQAPIVRLQLHQIVEALHQGAHCAVAAKSSSRTASVRCWRRVRAAYNDTYALLHEDAYEDAISIKVPGVDAKRLDVRLLQPLDLAVSKLSRFEVHDQEDIRALAIAGLIDAKSLRVRAEEALPSYVGETRRVRNSIALAEKLVKDSVPS